MSGRDDFEQVAEGVPFDNSDNGFTADETQSAIEETKEYSEGFPRSGIRSSYNGTISGNDWLGPNELLSQTPLAGFAVKTKLNEITWSNNRLRTNRAFRIQFRRGSKTGTIFYTLTVTSPNNGNGYVSGLSFEFDAGEVIFAQYLDDGLNCSDLDLTLWISRVPE